ncbi:MAG: hypothetical protein EOP61_04630 [Sphingomonadales bacterium]|nr:MAG: hypothetical protein EOP61_04630 [Sphingomonadales bacterium]
MTRTAILLAGVSLAMVSAAPAGADPRYLFGGTGDIPLDQPIETPNGTVQILMDDGAVVSLVGNSSFRLSGNMLVVDRGGVTVVTSGGNPLTIRLPGGGSAVVAGAASLTVNANGATGNVMGGSAAITAGGSTSQFGAGMAWRASPAGVDRVFANGAQAAPSGVAALRTGGIRAAAVNGLPIALGEALAAIGAQGDLVAAANRLQATAQNPALGAVPSGDVALLLGFSSRLAAALGGTTFQGTNPALIQVYLNYLASGGQAAQFQSAYTAIVLQYLQLLQSGGNAGQFTGLDSQALTTYLAYLQSSGGLAGLAEAQRGLIATYLAYLQGGGLPANFTVPGNYLSPATLATYLGAVQAYLDYLYAGGLPSGYGGLSTAALQAYLKALTDAGLLANLAAEQREFVTAYLAYLGGGGNPDTYPDLPDANVTTVERRLAYGVNRPGTTNATFGVSGNAVVKLDKDGNPVRQLPLNGTVVELAGAELVESKKSGEVSVGRFSNFSFFNGGTRYTVGENQGVHYVLAPPLENLPQSATFLYSLAAATHPTFGDGGTAPGTFDGQIVIAYGGTSVKTAVAGNVTMPGDATYAFSTSGGLAGFDGLTATFDPAFIQLTAAMTGRGRACGSGGPGCGLYMTILPSGKGATSLATSYESRSDNTADASFTGAAGFTLTGPYTPPPPPPPPPSGVENQFIAYVGNGPSGQFRTIDQRAPVRTTYDPATGAPIHYFWSDNENIGLGTATLADGGSAGVTGAEIGWGRWVNGTASGNFYGGQPVFGETGGHFISGDIPTNVPATGMFTYNLAGATTPTATDGTFGTLSSALAAVSFGSQPLIGLEFALSHGGVSYSWGTPGGIAQTSTNGLAVANPANGLFFGGAGSTAANRILTASGSGLACNATCIATVRGYLGGADAATLGLVYTLRGDGGYSIGGSAAFLKGDGYTPPAPPAFEGRANQVTVYAGSKVGIDNRQPTTVAYSSSGAPTGYRWELNDYSRENERPTIGSATEHESGGVGEIIGWTRWAGGTTGGKLGSSAGIELAENTGWHIVSGTPATDLPSSGTVNYALLGATAPTTRDASTAPGTFEGKLAVAFGAQPKVGIEFGITIGGASYAINTPGGVADPMQGMSVDTSAGRFNMVFGGPNLTATGSGAICGETGACKANVQGFLAGKGASHVGVAYTFGNIGYDKQVDGVAVFGKAP